MKKDYEDKIEHLGGNHSEEVKRLTIEYELRIKVLNYSILFSYSNKIFLIRRISMRILLTQ